MYGNVENNAPNFLSLNRLQTEVVMSLKQAYGHWAIGQ